MNEPTADYRACGDGESGCGHLDAYHCPLRGCRVILEMGAKTHDPNNLCGCPGVHQ